MLAREDGTGGDIVDFRRTIGHGRRFGLNLVQKTRLFALLAVNFASPAHCHSAVQILTTNPPNQ